MTTIEEFLAEWSVPIREDPEDMAQKRQDRSVNFMRTYQLLKDLNPGCHGALFFDTFTPDSEPRQVLIINKRNTRNRSAPAQVLVSEERLMPEDMTLRVLDVSNFRLRLLSKLISQQSGRLHESEEDMWGVGYHGFFLRHDPDESHTSVWHASGFRSSGLRDEPFSTPESLAARQRATSNLEAVLKPLVHVEPVITTYNLAAA